ncbi:MAG: TolC family protein [Caulobacteraceae bacterium]|nr:TolC family protein [Caulobacter sp.]
MIRLRTALRLGGACLAASALAGCIVGPAYRTPDRVSTAPAAFAETTAAVSASPPPGRWWRLYNDPNLDRLVDQALVRNTDLRVAEANLAEARTVLEEVRANRLPATALSAGASYGRSSNGGGLSVPSFGSVSGGTTGGGSGSGGSGTGSGGTTSSGGGTGSGGTTSSGGGTTTGSSGFSSTGRADWTYSAAFDAAYEVDLFGRIRRAIQAARADTEAYAEARDLVRVDTAAETARAYAQACTYGLQSDVQRRSLDIVSGQYDATVKQRELGSVSDFEVANARTLVEQTRAPIAGYEASRRASLYALAVLTGEPPEHVDAAAAACRKPPKLVDPIPVGDGAGLIRRRPDVRQAERQLAAASARIGVATADLFPTVSLGGVISTAGHNGGDLVSRSGVSYGLGPLISWNFPNLVAARARVREAKAETQAAFANFDGVVLTALQNTETTLATYGGELDRHVALQAARDNAAEAYRLSQVRLQNGAISQLDLFVIEETLVSADAALAASDAALINDQVSVFKALGGGWNDPAPIPLPPLPSKANARKAAARG